MADTGERRAGRAVRVPAEYYDHDDSDNCCFLCGEPRFSRHVEVEHYGFPFRFQRCACGLVKQTPMPNEKFFEWFFNSEVFFSARASGREHIWGYYDYFADEPSRLATSRRRWRKLRRLHRAGRPLNIMKIGPSTGTLLYLALQDGHNAIGCDVSSQFIDYAAEHYGVRVDHGRFERMGYDDGQFDLLFLFNVIENVPNQHEFLSEIRRTLRPGGRFVFNFVDMKRNALAALQKSKYFLYRPPVTYIFDRHVIARLMAKYGFEIEKVYRDVRHMHLEKISTLLGWKWLHSLARLLRIDRVNFPVYAYPSRIVVARKEA